MWHLLCVLACASLVQSRPPSSVQLNVWSFIESHYFHWSTRNRKEERCSEPVRSRCKQSNSFGVDFKHGKACEKQITNASWLVKKKKKQYVCSDCLKAFWTGFLNQLESYNNNSYAMLSERTSCKLSGNSFFALHVVWWTFFTLSGKYPSFSFFFFN